MKYGIATAIALAAAAGIGTFFYMQAAEADKAQPPVDDTPPPADEPLVGEVNI